MCCSRIAGVRLARVLAEVGLGDRERLAERQLEVRRVVADGADGPADVVASRLERVATGAAQVRVALDQTPEHVVLTMISAARCGISDFTAGQCLWTVGRDDDEII